MIVHYVYVLSISGKPFYVGISKNPARRLFWHKYDSYGELGKKIKSVKNLSEISIQIVATVNTKTTCVCKKCYRVEAKWIRKYLNDGHKLCNQKAVD